jgi:hypothetical protein
VTVEKAIIWTNGMVMAFDGSGNQVPEYQGREADVLPKLRQDFPNAKIVRGDWDKDVRSLSLTLW